MTSLQWGGRFAAPPDPVLLAFGSSLEDDLVLARYDVRTSRAHVAALAGGGVIGANVADALYAGLDKVALEIENGEFPAFARASGVEDVHGAIDARVRELDAAAGSFLHAGRSRNDQVATTLALYAADRVRSGRATVRAIAARLLERAREELSLGTLLAATTHLQPAQPVLLAFWLCAATEPFVRAAARFENAAAGVMRSCPLGSGAVSGSTLPLDREAACRALAFDAPSRNAMDAIGSRDAVLDCAHAFVSAVAHASRLSAEIVMWATPAVGYARLGDASSTGSSLMPQKKNPDVFELVRAYAAEAAGMHTAAVASTIGLPLSYHRDLQQTKRLVLQICEGASHALAAFERAMDDTTFVREAMHARAGDGYTVATDIADALIASRVSARAAHAHVGSAVAAAERESRPLTIDDLQSIAEAAGIATLHAPLDARSSVAAKTTAGSTSPSAVEDAIESLEAQLRMAQ